MKVILNQDVKGTGKKGQVLEVSDGFARNFLLPKKLASEATASNVNTAKQQQAAAEHKIEVEKAEAKALAEKLSKLSVNCFIKTGKDNRVFGSVTGKEISEALEQQHNIKIDKKKISCPSIKGMGQFVAEIKLYANISCKLNVTVSAQQ